MQYELARSFYSLARAVLSVELRGRVAGRMIDIQRSKSSRGFHPETVDALRFVCAKRLPSSSGRHAV